MKKLTICITLIIILLVIGEVTFTRSFNVEKFVEPQIIVSTLSTSSIIENKTPDEVRHRLEKATKTDPANHLRKFPFPYEAMLAISSDTDLTTVEEFEEYHRFLNTKEQTTHGPGLGLDIGDSSWMYIGTDNPAKVDKEGRSVEYSMSYFQEVNPDRLKDADKINRYFKAGWIDSLHTFGDFTRNDGSLPFTRDLAVAAWKAMNESGFKPKVWINHGNEANVQNFGAYNPKSLFKYHAGDDPKSRSYHTDLTIGNGIRYVWNSIGMNQFSYDFPLFPINLRDGRKVWGFYRYTHEIDKGRYDWTWSPHDLSRQINRPRLEQLASKGQYTVLAQHLGKDSEGFPFNPVDIDALQLLKSYQDEGKVLVARTQRLLDYARSHKFIRFSMDQIESKTWINISSIEDPVLGAAQPSLDEIRGLTFYVDDPQNANILLNLSPIPEGEIQRNEVDIRGRKSIGVRWFTPDFTDYTKLQ